MSIKLNTKETDITVYDKINLNHASGKQIIPLTTIIRGTIKSNLINLISVSLNLNDSERELYRGIIEHIDHEYNKGNDVSDCLDLYFITHTVAVFTDKNIVTYKRAVDTLVRLGVITVPHYRKAKIVDCYNCIPIDNAAKYFLIEVNTTD